MLAFSRKQVLQPKALDLNTVIIGISKMLPRMIGEDIELRIELAASLDQVRADPGQIEQILMNLAVNARDATPNGWTGTTPAGMRYRLDITRDRG